MIVASASISSATRQKSPLSDKLDRSSHACKALDTSKEMLCGDVELSQLLARSYKLRPRWPFQSFRLVMEMSTGTCDFYQAPKPGKPSFCCDITGDCSQPEVAVREAIGSFLIGCSRRSAEEPCRAVDLGANNGWFTAYMLQLGAHVVSVEPQTDLARGVEATAKLNCWSKRSTVINARACSSRDSTALCYRPVNASNCQVRSGWRAGHGTSQLTTVYGHECAALNRLPATVGGVPLRSVLLGGGAQRRRGAFQSRIQLDLVKMDVDGPEGHMLADMDDLISSRLLSIRTIIVEASFVKPSQMRRLQRKHGYTAYRLDAHDSRRYMTRSGWDAFSPGGTIARIDRFAAHHKEADRALTRYSPHNPTHGASDNGGVAPTPAGDNISRVDLEEELFGVRAMRHVYRAKPNLSLQAWSTLMQPIQHHGYESAPTQWVLTLEGDLTEPVNSQIREWHQLSPEYVDAKATGILPLDAVPSPKATLQKHDHPVNRTPFGIR